MSDDKPIDRRRFFRTGLAEILKPLARAVRPLEAMAHEIGKLEDPLPKTSALPQIRRRKTPFLKTTSLIRRETSTGSVRRARCPSSSSGKHAAAAATASGLVRSARSSSIAAAFQEPAPYIDVESQACVLCETLSCMQHCPSGALFPLSIDQIDIGTAVWHEYQCLRPSGGSCTICVDHCPVSAAAIELMDDKVVVHETGCTGCGVCQHDCPTWPKSITVTPRSERNARASKIIEIDDPLQISDE